jgi:Do/DeqQ family serine protease
MKKTFNFHIIIFFIIISYVIFDGAISWAEEQSILSRILPQSEQQIQLSFAPVVKKASPTVVNIYTTHKVQVRTGFSPLFNDPFFSQFFHAPPPMLREQQVNSLGSGVIIDSKGLVITSLHVVRGADNIRIVLNDKREFSAKIITEDASADLALLQINQAEDLPQITIVDSDSLEVGDLVLAIGNPFGVGQTVTSGIISGLARHAEGVSDYNFFIQTDAAINPGNSGGALVNMNGELIGINTAIYSKSGGSVGVGFAIPSTMVASLLTNRTPSGEIIRPYFGASLQDVNAEIARSLGLKRVSGALVQEVETGSPAAKAGVISGDVIIAFNGKNIDSAAALDFRIATTSITQPVSITLIRQGKVINAQAQLANSSEQQENDAVLLQGAHPLNGVSVLNLSQNLALHLGITSQMEGVVVAQIAPNSGKVFVRVGDIITECNGMVIRSGKDLQKALMRNSNIMSLTLIRGGNTMQLRIAN